MENPEHEKNRKLLFKSKKNKTGGTRMIKRYELLTLCVFIIVSVLLVYNIYQVNALSDRLEDMTGNTAVQDTKPDVKRTDGKVSIIEFSDFECPYCGRAAPTIKLVLETYGNDVEFTFRHFPLSFHKNARKAAEASECARDQGKFMEYHDILFENQQALGIDNLKQYADDLGLNTKKFNSCLDSSEKSELIMQGIKDGMAMGVSGTPAFFINDQMISGAQPFSEFKRIIDAELGR